jgi:chaperonin cofactor prefoldin|tara:strand:- start:497 stop:760 length:264 start_codon:yes stop_codon:yes gene_type:complete
MAFNRTFNQEEINRLKKLIQEGDQVLYEVEALQTGLRETVKAIAEEMELKPAILNKAIKVAHKANFQEEYDKFDELETILESVGKTL